MQEMDGEKVAEMEDALASQKVKNYQTNGTPSSAEQPPKDR